MMKNRRECEHFDDLGYDYACGASEAHCNLSPPGLYCIHEGHNHPCPLENNKK